MGKKVRVAGVIAASLGLVVTIASPASAYELQVRCDNPASRGYIDYTWVNSTRINVSIAVSDYAEDGHHARARLLTENRAGQIVYWAWRKDLNGAFNGYIKDATYASDAGGIVDVGVQVGTYEGDEPLDLCSSWDSGPING
ncbi:hypothetical protein BJ965_001716 [Streptomyces luteogriseus]|uniref:Uncharacterized protein n=1 Tax=Streptomyces luteogriseus TaxID=68233 RepID=A0A7W7DJ76_9ACTN|nr:hypothetical protein [Streptomyces luteogriseus]MBB4711834.1 hypothetical protein [Streptomyces luteogriseus]